jgi:RNA polymerase sigma-70 factor (ECF subfamily)
VGQELALDAAAVDDPRAMSQPVDLGRLFDRCHRRLYALARRMSRDFEESRDLVQEAFLRAARRIDAVPQGASEAEAWLVRVLVNLCKDRQRRRVVREHHTRETAPQEASAGHEGPFVARATVRAALATLSARRRACVVLHHLEDLSVREVSELLGLQPVTVRWHLSAARRQLARWRERQRQRFAPGGGERHDR